MAEKLVCTSPYRNGARGLVYNPGDTVEEPGLIAFLLSDAPGSFRDADQPTADDTEAAGTETSDKAVDQPVADKMVKQPGRKK